MRYGYGEIFAKLGIPNMGRRGVGWCALDPNGTLVLMAHERFFHTFGGSTFYIGLGHRNLPTASRSASQSIGIIADYFKADNPIILPIGEFISDGGFAEDGTVRPAIFHYATGRIADGTMLYFDRTTGSIACEVTGYRDVDDLS